MSKVVALVPRTRRPEDVDMSLSRPSSWDLGSEKD